MGDFDVIVAALVAGSTAGVSDAVKSAVTDAYAILHKSLRRVLGQHSAAMRTVTDRTGPDAVTAENPEALRQLLGRELADAKPELDPKVLEAAKNLLRVAGETIPTSITVHRNDGIVAGVINGPVTLERRR